MLDYSKPKNKLFCCWGNWFNLETSMRYITNIQLLQEYFVVLVRKMPKL